MQVLYRKYRPKTFSEVEGQDHIVRTLQGAILSGNIGHAYLFCGPRGTGKTTMARLFAKVMNCESEAKKERKEPCNVCSSCNEINEGRSLDLIEIDAASNRGIDEIRNLKDSVRVSAMSSKYKVFIIDEVHMLTPPAFNALLKTLEEPPAHVLFILATTEPHKILDTILSRVQRFDFKKITSEKIISKLRKVAAAEGLKVEDEALTAVASIAGGSLRDAESALSKIIAYAGGEVTARDVAEILGIVPLEEHETLILLMAQKKGREAMARISNLYEGGIDLDHFNKQFIKYLRTALIQKINNPAASGAGPTDQSLITPEYLVKTINAFVKAGTEMKTSPVPQLPLELAILELTK